MNRKIPLYALITALTVAASLFVIIPMPGTNGFVTLCDAGIYTAALLLGPIGGLSVGALSGGMIDLLSGYPQWMVFSLIIHGLQGWLAGKFFQQNRKLQYFGLILGSLIMIIGYALATQLLYGLGAGIASLPSNFLQSGFGALVAIPLTEAIKQALPKFHSKREGF